MSVELALVFRNFSKMMYALYGKLLFFDFYYGTFTVKDLLDGFEDDDEHRIYTFILELKRLGIIEITEEGFDIRSTTYRLRDREHLGKAIYETEIMINNMDDLEDRIIPDNLYVLTGNVPDSFRNSKRIALTELLPIYSTLQDMILRAREEIIILNPFFDKSAVNELKDAILNAMDRGVRVRIVTRYVGGMKLSNLEALGPIIESSKMNGRSDYFMLYRYESEEEREGRFLDFHAKMVISDRNGEAYLGSANLTYSGLHGGLELGTKITGRYVSILYELVRHLIKTGYIRKVDIGSGR